MTKSKSKCGCAAKRIKSEIIHNGDRYVEFGVVPAREECVREEMSRLGKYGLDIYVDKTQKDIAGGYVFYVKSK